MRSSKLATSIARGTTRFIEFKLYAKEKQTVFYFLDSALWRPSFKILTLYKYFDLGLPKIKNKKSTINAPLFEFNEIS